MTNDEYVRDFIRGSQEYGYSVSLNRETYRKVLIALNKDVTEFRSLFTELMKLHPGPPDILEKYIESQRAIKSLKAENLHLEQRARQMETIGYEKGKRDTIAKIQKSAQILPYNVYRCLICNRVLADDTSYHFCNNCYNTND